jgi:hypothetical protein
MLVGLSWRTLENPLKAEQVIDFQFHADILIVIPLLAGFQSVIQNNFIFSWKVNLLAQIKLNT